MTIDLDLFARLALVAEIVLMGVVRAHYAGAALGEKKGRRLKEKPIALVVIGLGGLAFYYVFFTYLFSWSPAWMSLGLPDAARWAGLVVSLLPLAFLWWVFKTIGKAGSKYVITFDDQDLVTTGPYARIRHPMYTGFLLWSATALVFTDSWGIGAGFFGFLVIVVAVRLKSEEQALIEHFGDDYLDYMARTGRFFPRLRPSTQGQ